MPVQSARLESTGETVKFGRLPATSEQKRRMIPLGSFLKRYGGKPPPTTVDYHSKASESLGRMLGNDRYGNCVVVAELHGIGAWSANEPGGTPIVPTDKEAIDQYARICGPGDNGCYIPAVLDAFRDRGLQAGGAVRKMEGYVSVNPRDQLLLQYAIWLFGGIHFGINWPNDWMGIRPGFVLKPTNSRIVGGHAVMGVGYDTTGIQISTWGIVGTLSWEALADGRFVDEAYARLGEDWFNADGITASGVNVKALRDALRVVAGGGYPDIPTEPEPPTPPTPTPPVPGEWDWQFDRTFSALGHSLRVFAGVDWSRQLTQVRKLDFLALAVEVAKLVRAFMAKDFAGMASAVMAILRILGINLGTHELRQVVNSLNRESGSCGYSALPEKNAPDDSGLTNGRSDGTKDRGENKAPGDS